MDPSYIAAIRANAGSTLAAPSKAKFINGQYVLDQPQAASGPVKKKPNFIQSLFPSIGGLVGGVGGGAAGGALAGTAILPGVGTAVGGLLGALLGGGAGGAIGKVAENKALGDSAGHDVLKEGLIQGALSAGPVRLAKTAFTGGRALLAGGEALGAEAAARAAEQGGGRLATALAGAEQGAAAPSIIKTALSNKLTDAKETLAAKALSLTGPEKSKILTKTGEKAGAIASRYGIRSADDVAKAAQPLFDEYANTVAAIPGTFGKQQIGDAFKAVYEPLLAKGAPLGKQTEGNALKAEAESLLKGIKGTITPAELNAKKTAFDDLAYEFKLTDPTSHNVNKAARDVIHDLVTTAADNAGLETAHGTLKDTGAELIKLKRLGDAAGKHIDGAGGRTILGLGGLPGGVIGATGGPIPAAIGVGANLLANSATGRKVAALGAEKLAEKSAGAAAKSGLENYGIKNVAKRVLPAGLLGALQSQSPSSTDSAANPNTSNTIPTNDISASSANDPQQSIPGQEDTSSPFHPANVEKNVQNILANGGKLKDVNEYLGLVETMQKLKGGSQDNLTLSDQAIGRVSDYNNALSQLSQLRDTFEKNPVSSPITGRIRGANPFDTTAQTQQAQINAVKQIVGKALEGGVLRKEDEVKYAKILPTLSDSPQVAKNKIAQVISLLQNNYDNYIQLQRQAGKGAGQVPTDLTAALSASGY